MALITGISGQDGAYLAKLLLEKGYIVHGGMRPMTSGSIGRLIALGIENDVMLHELEMLEFSNLRILLETIQPSEIYNFAAQSSVSLSLRRPLHTSDVDAMGPLRMLEAIRQTGSKAKFYQASTAEMFGNASTTPQDEDTPFSPRNPYGIAKLFAHWATVSYRENFGIYAASGIMFNHESPLRSAQFVSRKLTAGLAAITAGNQDCLYLGNIDAKRDWGFAGDYVEGVWRMLQQPKARDFVLATGNAHSVRDFVEVAARYFRIDIEWQGRDKKTIGIDRASGQIIVRIDPKLYRPPEDSSLCGDPSRAEEQLGWRRSTDFADLVHMMCEHDRRLLQND